MTQKSPDPWPGNASDYPLSEKSPGRIKGPRNKSLDEITLESVLADEGAMADLKITAEALLEQAEIARAAERSALAENFERAAEMTKLPQEEIMSIYELLRPGRAADRQELEKAATKLRQEYQAHRLAAHLEEAAEIYERRDLFKARF